MARLREIPGVKLLGPRSAEGKSGVVTFNVGSASPHEVAIMLDSMAGVCVRSGVFCAEPAMNFLGAPKGAVRASIYLYNTPAEVELFAETLAKVAKVLA